MTNSIINHKNIPLSYSFSSHGFINMDHLENAPLCLYDLGISQKKDITYYYDNVNRSYEGYLFQYTIKGHGIYEKDGNIYTLTPGKAFFVHFPENSKYYCSDSTDENEWEFLYIHFNGEAAAPFFQHIINKKGTILEIPSNSRPIIDFINFHNRINHGYLLQRFEGSEYVYHFLTSLLQELENKESNCLTDYINQSMLFIQKEYQSISGIDYIADMLGISLPHYIRLFRKETGNTPMQFLTNVKLQHAIDLLLNSSISIESIAKQCGFSCGNYFSKVFRKYLGISPSDYRKQYGNA